MFRDVPECSGMFHIPGFIDAPSTAHITKCPPVLSYKPVNFEINCHGNNEFN